VIAWEETSSPDPHNSDEATYEPVWSNTPWQDLAGPDGIEEHCDLRTRRLFSRWIDKNPIKQQSRAPGEDVFQLELRAGTRVSFLKAYIPVAKAGAKCLVVTSAINVVVGAPNDKDNAGTAGVPPSGSQTKEDSSNMSVALESMNTPSDIDDLPPISLEGKDIVPSTPATAPASETDCKTLLELTDWSKTCLGPRKDWSPSLEVIIRIVMASETQDGLWLGEDFIMI